MDKKMRQYLGMVISVLTYYLIHEGAHLLLALVMGVFKSIHFMGIGVQIDVFAEQMSDVQMFAFCAAGVFATSVMAYVLVGIAPRIVMHSDARLRAVMYYVTLTMLFLDPIYLCIICGFVGGGDMNGFILLMPEIVVRMFFGFVLLINAMLFWKRVLPLYRQSFVA